MATKAKRTVTESALRVLELDEIKVDPSYQRPRSEHAVAKITKGFNPKAVGVPVVGERSDGTLWVVDGQQRIHAMREMKDKNRRWVRCEVFASSGPEHEAEIFRLINCNRTKLSAEQLYHASLTAGDETCWRLKKLLDEYGFTVPKVRRGKNESTTPATHAKRIRTVKFLSYVLSRGHKYGGEDAVRFILEVVSKAWPDDPLKQKSEIIEGLYNFRQNRGGDVDLDRLVPRLNLTTPAKVIYSAGMGIGSRAANAAEVFERLYRKRGPKS
jgi:hypothetical protein